MQEVQENFVFAGQELRTLLVDDEPHFILKDLCEILELGNPRQVKTRLEDGVISNYPIQDRLGREQTVTTINEDGLYDVILDSRKPEARQFRKWITSEVVPSIRKTGGYVAENRADDFVDAWLPQVDEHSRSAIASTLEQNRKLINENKKLSTTIESNQPKVVFAEAYEVSDDLITIKEMANLLNQKGVDTGEHRLYRWLRENGYVCSKGSMHNLPTQKSLDLEILQIKKGLRTGSSGEIKQTRTTKVNGKGQIYFINKFLGVKQKQV